MQETEGIGAIFDPSQAPESNFFVPYRTVGEVADGKCFTYQRLGKVGFILVSVGHQFLVYRQDSLRVSFTSPRMRHPITHLAARKVQFRLEKNPRSLIQFVVSTFEGHDGRRIRKFCSALASICLYWRDWVWKISIL